MTEGTMFEYGVHHETASFRRSRCRTINGIPLRAIDHYDHGRIVNNDEQDDAEHYD